ncbi:MAG: hypothetical protein ABIA21_02200 [Candidatus Aenigmatarchaeota archaeon]
MAAADCPTCEATNCVVLVEKNRLSNGSYQLVWKCLFCDNEFYNNMSE